MGASAAFESTAGGRTQACFLDIEAVRGIAYVFGTAAGMTVDGLALGMVAEQPVMVPGKEREERHRL